MPPRRSAPAPSPVLSSDDAPSNQQIVREQLRPLNVVFCSIFKDADLTMVQKTKQWINVVAYSAGKIVGRMQRMTEADLCIEMNKAYYLRLQVIFADIRENNSFWADNFDFGCTFSQMMTHTFGAGAARANFFFDYGNNEALDAEQVDAAKSQWTSPFLWNKYGEIKTEMQNQMLPVLMKQRFEAVGDSYGWKSGGSFAEVTYSFLGALFQVQKLSQMHLYFMFTVCSLIHCNCRTMQTRSGQSVRGRPLLIVRATLLLAVLLLVLAVLVLVLGLTRMLPLKLLKAVKLKIMVAMVLLLSPKLMLFVPLQPPTAHSGGVICTCTGGTHSVSSSFSMALLLLGTHTQAVVRFVSS
jgi:hypothetical protein